MLKEKSEDILGRRKRICTPGEPRIAPKLQFCVKLRGDRALYHQSNLSKKYPFFLVLRCRQPCKLALLEMRSVKPLSLLSAKILTFLCQSDVEQSRIRKVRRCGDSPLRDDLAFVELYELVGIRDGVGFRIIDSLGNRIHTGDIGVLVCQLRC